MRDYRGHPVELNTKRGYKVIYYEYSRGLVEIFRPDGTMFWHGYDARYGEPINRALDWCRYIDSDQFKDE